MILGCSPVSKLVRESEALCVFFLRARRRSLCIVWGLPVEQRGKEDADEWEKCAKWKLWDMSDSDTKYFFFILNFSRCVGLCATLHTFSVLLCCSFLLFFSQQHKSSFHNLFLFSPVIALSVLICYCWKLLLRLKLFLPFSVVFTVARLSDKHANIHTRAGWRLIKVHL